MLSVLTNINIRSTKVLWSMVGRRQHVKKYDVMKYDIMKYDVMKYNMTYYVMTYMSHDI